MRTKLALTFLVLLGVLGCRAVSTPVSVSTSDHPLAVVERDSAWFVFPRETDSVFAWHVPGARQFADAPERIWTVEIAPYWPNEIFELTIRQEWRSDRRTGVASLGEVVRGSSVYAARAASVCVCVTRQTDPNIRADVIENRVRIVVHGQAAIARWLTRTQDTVTFTRLEADTSRHHAVRTISEHAVVVRRASR